MAKARTSSPLFTLIAIITVVAALYIAKEILLPLALAILLSFLLTPLANRLERWKLPRVPAVILVASLSFAVLGGLGWVVTGQLVALSRDLDSYKDNVLDKIKAIKPSSKTIGQMSKAIEEVGKELTGDNQPKSREQQQATDGTSETAPAAVDDAPPAQAADDSSVPPSPTAQPLESMIEQATTPDQATSSEAVEVKVVEMPPSPLTQVQTWLGPLVAPLTTAGMVIVMVLFMLLDRENQRNRLIQLFGTANLHTTTEAFHDVAERVGRYLRMQFLINAGYGVAVGVGLSLIGVPGAIMWGVLGFSLRFLPYLGPWIAAVMPIMVSLGDSAGWTQPVLVMGMYVVYELLLNNVAEPMLYGNSIGVSTVGVILAAIFWTWLWGPIGLILAMPMTVCLVVTARYVPQLRFFTVLFADQPPLTNSERVYQRLLAFDYNEPLKVAKKYLKSSSLVGFYDEVLIPALVLAERDRHAGLLNDEQEESVRDAAADLVEELGQQAAEKATEAAARDGAPSSDTTPRAPLVGERPLTEAQILCMPLRDEADKTAATMLVQLLEAEGFAVDAEGTASLTSELVDRVAETACDIVVISILPPIAPRDSRLLWKRLRARYPDLPIVVGFWNSGRAQEMLVPPENDSESKVATSLAEAVTYVRSTAARLQTAKKELPRAARTAAG